MSGFLLGLKVGSARVGPALGGHGEATPNSDIALQGETSKPCASSPPLPQTVGTTSMSAYVTTKISGGEPAGHNQGRDRDRYLMLLFSLRVLIMFNVIFVLVLPALSM